ncbi:MAG: ABC transporter permease subunit, partial [Clostridiales Family XIII bacterium]|nr:ABC transporter permease subunit [Clostridiales Family XIII bacterium]
MVKGLLAERGGGRISQLGVLTVCLAVFTVTLILSLFSLFSKAFMDGGGDFVGFENYIHYFRTPALSVSVGNTIDISLWSAAVSMALGLLYAYALTRTRIRAKQFFKYAALIPIFIPTIVHALGLVYIFGKQGIITRMGFEIELYGRLGIILSEIIFTFPQAFLMFYVALEFVDGRLYEAADSMGVSPLKKFFRITLPEIKYSVINVFFVCFTLAFTDFGAPKVIGGSYNVLATDIYKQVAGQFNMNLGAVVGTLLLIPAVLTFTADRLISNKNSSVIGAKATPLVIKAARGRDAFYFVFCALITLFLLLLIASLAIGALSEYYPYKMSPTLKHFTFNESAGGIESFYHSLEMAFLTALIGTAFVFVYAYMMEKTSG